ncbi:unnamed protein product [Toxocara canis]|uniref:Transmembrane protein n=1 Tax=Toxocara canis TaxID=6265 RepID=A0A183UFY3_TOXCA|nr:unnamed protein product [Toxocara canis]
MAVIGNVILQEVQQTDGTIRPVVASPLLYGPTTTPLIWVAVGVVLSAALFIISYALRCLYMRRITERMDHHLSRFAPRIPGSALFL